MLLLLVLMLLLFVVVVAVEVVAGGGGAPLFITGSGFLKTSLHGVKKAGGGGGGGGAAPLHLQNPPLQTDCLYEDLKKNNNNYVFDAILVDGAIFLKASLHGVKKAGRFARPHLQAPSSRVLGS